MTNQNLYKIRRKLLNIIRKVLKVFSIIAKNYGAYLFAIAWFFTMLLGYFGYKEYFILNEINVETTDVLYYTLQMFALNSGWVDWSDNSYVLMLDVARFSAAVISLSAVLLLLSTVFSEQLRKLQLWLCFNHIIICGNGFVGSRFAQELRKEHEIVFIDPESNNDFSSDTRNADSILVKGDPADVSILKKAGINRAKYLICALENDNKNAKVAIQASNVVDIKNGILLTCFVHVFNPELHEIFRVNEFTCKKDFARLEIYNIFNFGARQMLRLYPAFSGMKNIFLTNNHIMIVGLGNMGESVLIRAAREWWFQNKNSGRKLLVTIVDKTANNKKESLCIRYPSLDVSCDFRTFNVNINSPEHLKDSFVREIISKPVNCAYICLREDIDGILFSLRLSKALKNMYIPIVVRINNADNIPTTLLNEARKNDVFENIHMFNLWDSVDVKELIESGTRELIAKAFHEYYVLHQESSEEKTKSAETEWKDVTEDERNRNEKPVDDLTIKMKHVACKIDKLESWNGELFEFKLYELCKLARYEHERWCLGYFENGWKHGPHRSEEKKTHPDLVDWSELDSGEKSKNIYSIKDVPLILSKVDLDIRRINLTELIAEALFFDQVQETNPINIDKNDLIKCDFVSYKQKTKYIEKAYSIELCIKKIGCGISGRAYPEKNILELTESEKEILAKAYYEMLIHESLKTSEKYESLSDLNILSTDSNSQWIQFLEEVSRWPGIIAKNDLSIYRFKDAQQMVEEDREALLEIFTEDELISLAYDM